MADANSNPSHTGESTTPFQDGRSPATGPADRVSIVVGPGTAPQQTAELQALLWRRLANATLIGTCVGVVAMMFVTPSMLPGNWKQWLLIAIVVTNAAVWAVVLRVCRPLSLRALRSAEIAFASVIMAVLAWHSYDMLLLRRFPGFLAALGEGQGVVEARGLRWTWGIGDWGMIFLASYPNLMWFALIVGYGLVIPNTWRRCTVVVGAMAVIPMAMAAAVCLTNDTASWKMNASFLFQVCFWMSLAMVFAIFGSHRIEVLRREAFAARQLGQYRLKRLLGAGGMGEVYLAEHVLLKRPCAVKLIRLERAGDPKHLRRFEREVQTMATLTSWNTVEIFDYGHTPDGTFYYVMEYLPGLNLEELVSRHGPLPPGRAIHFLRQVCGALWEAHAAGLIHRDIKPSNIIACERGKLPDVAKLLDFGLVRVFSQGDGAEKLTQEGTIAGTPAYMAPEQAAGAEDVDERTDIYCLGAVAYFLLTGQPPFVRKSGMAVVAAHLHEPVRPLTEIRADVPADLQEVILRCLEKKRACRFADAECLEQALSQCQGAKQWTREEARAWWREQAASAP